MMDQMMNKQGGGMMKGGGMMNKSESTSSVEFTPPKDFTAPEGTAGEPFDLVCTFEPLEGGKLRLTKLGDYDMDGEAAPQSKPDYSSYARGMMQDIPTA